MIRVEKLLDFQNQNFLPKDIYQEILQAETKIGKWGINIFS